MQSNLPVEVVNPVLKNGIYLPVQALVTDGLQGRWYVECNSCISSRNLANPVAGVYISGANGTGGSLSRSFSPFPNPLPVVDDRFGPFLTERTTAVIGNVWGMTWGSGPFLPLSQNPVLIQIMRTPSVITDLVLWVTLSSNAAGGGITSSTTDPGSAGTGWAGFRFSAGIDAGWVGFTRSNTTNLISTTSALRTVLADTTYIFKCRKVPGVNAWAFSVDGLAEQQITTNLPSSVAYMPVNGVRTNVGAVREFLYNSELSYLVPA